jgi:lipopolysaccharide export system permease protein
MLILRTLLVVLGLTMAAWVGQSLRFTKLVTQCGLSSWGFLKIAIHLFPDLLLLTLPIGFAISVGIVYQQLHLSCQLVVARSVGLSPAAIARPILLLSAGIIGILYGTNSYLSPLSIRHFRNVETQLLRQIQILSAAEGGQVTDHDGVSIFARQKDQEGTLLDIVMHDRHTPSAPRSVYAKRGRLVKQGDQVRLVLEQGQRIDFDNKTHNVTTIHFDKYETDISNTSFIVRERTLKPHEHFLTELFPDPGTVGPSRMNCLHAEAHQRLISPLLVLVFSLTGFLTVLRSEGQRSTSSKNLVWTVLSIMTIECFNLGIFSLSNKYPALSFVNYGVVGSLLVFLFSRLFYGRF